MKRNADIIRAWKDPEYRATLSAAELEGLPGNPAGDLSDAELEQVSGGAAGRTQKRTWCGSCKFGTLACCPPKGPCKL